MAANTQIVFATQKNISLVLNNIYMHIKDERIVAYSVHVIP